MTKAVLENIEKSLETFHCEQCCYVGLFIVGLSMFCRIPDVLHGMLGISSPGG